jgi:mxaJ protein
MFLVYRSFAILLAASGICAAAELRVCADPDNLPYSNVHAQGFENKLAELAGRYLGRTVRYVWLPQRGRFLKALREDACDVEMGVPAGFKLADTTAPYYRSSYVFVTRRSGAPGVRSFNDPGLRHARIGLLALSADDAAVPPAHILARRGMASNIVWFRQYQNFIAPNQPGTLIDAVASGQVDVAIAWGPQAGYFALSSPVPLRLNPVPPSGDAKIPLAFNISIGVRPGDRGLVRKMNRFIEQRRVEIRRILERYGVPEVERTAAANSLGR